MTFFIFHLLSSSAFANSNFKTSYDATYIVDEEGTTHAILNIEITNKTTESFASSYKTKIGLFSLTNIKAKDSEGPLSLNVEKTDQGQIITIVFNKKVVGIGKTQKFTISFDTRDISEKQGSIWEINIPGLKDQKDFEAFTVHVRPPKSFGQPTYIKPEIKREELDFSKDDLGTGGISIAFGDIQYYSFSLSYHIENTSIFSSTESITIPPTTNYQTVIIDEINPKPIQVKEDVDGNWLAQYYLLPSQNISVTVTGRAIVNLIPKKQILSDTMRKEYTKQKLYWESNEKITKLAKDLQTPEAIYNYVVKHLIYDFSRVTANSPRLGAINVLENPNSAVCLEFTDLFVAIARAAGIPAREIDGFAYAQNSMQRPLSLVKDILHAWPEYYDENKQTWIMVDPTWGNTTSGIDYFHTLDFDHLAFVIKGEQSNSPIPAGGYKTKKFENEKDIHVSFADPFELPPTTLNFRSSFPKKATAGLPYIGTILLSSDGGISFPSQDIYITSKDFYPDKQIITSGAIPPFGTIKIPVNFSPQHFLTNKKANITIRLQDNTIIEEIEIKPFFFTHPIITGGILFVSITFIILIITTRTRYIPFFR